MKLKQFLEQLNQLAKEKPEALDMEIMMFDYNAGSPNKIEKEIEICNDEDFGTFVGLFCK
jgi:hypothetical protein